MKKSNCFWRDRKHLAIPERMYIYALVDPISKERMYIGKTNDVNKRLALHLSDSRKGNRTSKSKWIRNLLAVGKKPKVEILETVPFEFWQAAESKWIAKAKKLGWPILNCDNGGGGPVTNANDTDD